MNKAIKKEAVEALLSYNKYNVDEKNAHIEVNRDQCARCKGKPCLRICPAGLYKLEEDGRISFDYAGCLECGTCRIACKELGQGGIEKWEFPNGTFGVCFRYG